MAAATTGTQHMTAATTASTQTTPRPHLISQDAVAVLAPVGHHPLQADLLVVAQGAAVEEVGNCTQGEGAGSGDGLMGGLRSAGQLVAVQAAAVEKTGDCTGCTAEGDD